VTYPSPVSATRPKVGQRTELALYRHGGRTNYLRPANRRSGPNHRPVHARGRSGLPRRPWAIDHGRTRRTRRQLPPAGSRARLPARAVPEWLPLSNRHPGLRARLNRWPTRGQDAVQNCQEVRRWHRALARPKTQRLPGRSEAHPQRALLRAVARPRRLDRVLLARIAHFAGSGSPVSETGLPARFWRRRLMPIAAPKAIIAAISPVAASTYP
jgi:hypothetical protein